MIRCLAIMLVLLALSGQAASEERPAFLFVGSYHMNNHNRDMFNLHASDVTSSQRQKQIREVVDALVAFRPTKIMIERNTADQGEVDEALRQTCAGKRETSKEEYEQLGFRVACRLRIPVVAVNYNDLGPIENESRIDLSAADPAAFAGVQRLGDLDNRRLQEMEASKSVGELLQYVNSDAKTAEVASRYYLIANLKSETDAVGANWVEYWYGRNLRIFDNVRAATDGGDRVLVIYGYGHGYILRHMAQESQLFDVLNTEAFLKAHL